MSAPPQVRSTSFDERSWRPVSGRTGLTIRRRNLLLLAAVILGFLSLFVWLLGKPVLEPQVHLIGLQSTTEQLDSHWSVRSTRETLYTSNVTSNLEGLYSQLSAGRWSEGKRIPNLFFGAPPEAHRLLEQLKSVSDSSSDVMILFLTTQTVDQNGKVMFSWDGRPDDENRWWNAQELIDALKAHPASLKFVVLDAGQTQWAPQQGILISNYLNALKSQLQETHDPSLWVLCSHSTGEISYLDHKYRNSLFSIAVLEGLRGEADFDRNQVITIRELTQYVVWKVGVWSQAYAGYDFRQTPHILWGRGNLTIESDWPDLVPVVDELAESEDAPPAENSETAQQDQKVAFLYNSNDRVNKFARVVKQAFESAPRSMKGRLIPASGMGLPGMMLLWQVSPETQVAAESLPASNPPLNDLETTAELRTAEPQLAPGSSQLSRSIDPQAEKTGEDDVRDDSEEELSEDEKSLLEAWKIRDRLLRSEGKEWTVALRFPLEFRRLEQELIRLEFLARNADEANRSAWNRQLSRIVVRFQSMEEELRRKIPLPPASDPVQRISKQQPFHSIALCELLLLDPDPEVVRIKETLENLLAALEADDRVSAQNLAADLEQHRRYIEVDLACQVAKLPAAIPSGLKTKTLQNRIRLEQLAARAFGYHAWIRDRLGSAELLLSRGESVLLNHIPGHHVTEIRQLSERIEFELDGIDSVLRTVSETDRLASDLCLRFNEYVKLSRLSGDVEAGLSPAPGELSDLISMLAELEQQFTAPDPKQIPQMSRNYRKLIERDRLIRNRISQSVQRLTQEPGETMSGFSRQREALLRVSLVSGPERRLLWSALEASSVTEEGTAPAELPSLAGLISPALSPRTVDGMYVQIELQAQLAELALLPGSLSNSQLSSLREVALLNTSSVDDALLDRCSEFGLLLEGLYASVTEKMSVELPQGLTALNAQQTSAHLRGWSTFTRLLSPAVSGRHFELEPSALRFSADLRELLVWQVNRLDQQRSPSDLFSAADPSAADRRYRRAIRLTWPRIPAPEDSGPSMELTAPETLTLARSELPTLKLVCRNNLDQKVRSVLVLEYDQQSIDAFFSSPAQGEAVIDSGILKQMSLFPQESQLLGLELEPHSSRTIDIDFLWRNRRSRLSPISLTVIGQYELPEQNIRKTVVTQRTVRLERPFSDSWLLSLREGVAGKSDQSLDDGLVLYPFPNRATSYSFQLDYLGEEHVKVDVELIEEPLEKTPDDRPGFLLKDQGLSFSSENISAPLNWSSIWATGPSAGETQAEESTVLRVSPPIRPNLVLKISAPESGQVAWLPIRLLVQRPRRYVNASVAYDRARELVRVNLESRPGIPLPSAEIPIVCRLEAEPENEQNAVEVSAKLSAMNPGIELRLPLQAKTDSTRHLSISADGVNREFLYSLPADQTVNDLPELLDRSRLELLSPRMGQAFALQGPPLKVNLEIDLPVADLFSAKNGSVAEIWLDSLPNGKIDPAETAQEIDSDRMVEMMILEPDENGRFSISTHVTDWELLLSRAGLPEGELKILGQLRTSRGLEAANSVTVILDGDAPVLKSRAPEYVAENEVFSITLVPESPDSSGVSRVDAQIDLAGDGQFDADATIYRGLRTEIEGQWLCQIPTTNLPPGRYTVLLEARDAVGNISEIVSQSMNIVSTEQLKLLEAGEAVPLTGIVVFGKEPVAEAVVTLTAGAPQAAQSAGNESSAAEGAEVLTVKTDEAGRFRFESVPPGEWTVSASRLLLNRLRTYTQQIEIAPPPSPAGILRIRLR